MKTTITAKPIVWHETKYPNGNEWQDEVYGFHISFEPEETPGNRFQTCWGEGEADEFSSIDEAKTWCQKMIDSWIAKHAVVESATP